MRTVRITPLNLVQEARRLAGTWSQKFIAWRHALVVCVGVTRNVAWEGKKGSMGTEYRVVSVDSGSSCLKMYDGETRVFQPAVIRSLRRDEAHVYADEIEVDGKRYVVGSTALVAAKGQDHPFLERGYHGSHDQYVQICHGLEQMGLEDGVYDAIMYSLPYSESMDDTYKRRVKERLEFRWSAAGRKRSVTFRHAATMPQGVGALRLWQSQNTERPRMVSLVDLGSCTADFVTVARDDGDYQYCLDKSKSLRSAKDSDPLINCKRFRDAWAARVGQIDGMQLVPFGYHDLMRLPAKNDFRVRCGPSMVDLGPAFRATVQQFTSDVRDMIKSVLEDVWYQVDKILLTGGGAEFVDVSTWNDDRCERLGIWANAEGQYLAAKSAGQPDASSKRRVRVVQDAEQGAA